MRFELRAGIDSRSTTRSFRILTRVGWSAKWHIQVPLFIKRYRFANVIVRTVFMIVDHDLLQVTLRHQLARS